MKILVLDGTEDGLYYNLISKYFNTNHIDVETVTNRAAAKLSDNKYDIIIMSNAEGRMDLYGMCERIIRSKLNRKCDIILMLDSPTKSKKIEGLLKGRSFRALKSNQTAELCSIFERN